MEPARRYQGRCPWLSYRRPVRASLTREDAMLRGDDAPCWEGMMLLRGNDVGAREWCRCAGMVSLRGYDVGARQGMPLWGELSRRSP